MASLNRDFPKVVTTLQRSVKIELLVSAQQKTNDTSAEPVECAEFELGRFIRFPLVIFDLR